jgi:hypothetical protein
MDQRSSIQLASPSGALMDTTPKPPIHVSGAKRKCRWRRARTGVWSMSNVSATQVEELEDKRILEHVPRYRHLEALSRQRADLLCVAAQLEPLEEQRGDLAL